MADAARGFQAAGLKPKGDRRLNRKGSQAAGVGPRESRGVVQQEAQRLGLEVRQLESKVGRRI